MDSAVRRWYERTNSNRQAVTEWTAGLMVEERQNDLQGPGASVRRLGLFVCPVTRLLGIGRTVLRILLITVETKERNNKTMDKNTIKVRHWFLEAPICRSCGTHVPVFRKVEHWVIGEPMDPKIPFRYVGFGECPHCYAIFEAGYGLN